MLCRALLLAAGLLAAPVAASAQIVMRPEPAPARVATNEAWYRAGDPILHRGEAFFPAGPQIFFDGNLMVHVGEFRGVPLYVDPTLETGSIVYVPIGGGLMQPYEKLRIGDLAGTSGSRTPSFPPATATTLETARPVATTGRTPQPPVGEPAIGTAAAPQPGRVITIAPRPPRAAGIWIDWNGQSWRASGAAVRVGPQLTPIGTFNGRTVFRGPGDDRTIWIETAQGLAAPWRR